MYDPENLPTAVRRQMERKKRRYCKREKQKKCIQSKVRPIFGPNRKGFTGTRPPFSTELLLACSTIYSLCLLLYNLFVLLLQKCLVGILDQFTIVTMLMGLMVTRKPPRRRYRSALALFYASFVKKMTSFTGAGVSLPWQDMTYTWKTISRRTLRNNLLKRELSLTVDVADLGLLNPELADEAVKKPSEYLPLVRKTREFAMMCSFSEVSCFEV
jgi:hypothetical protein